MSRSVDHGNGVANPPLGRTLRMAAAAGLAATLAMPVQALAGPADGLADPSGTGVAPVVPVITPVVDLITPTSDLPGLAIIEEREKKVDVRLDANILFAKDSDVIRPTASGRLREVALTLRARGKGRVAIDGYTDDLGTVAHGLDLSRRRANAVAGRLRPFLPAAQFPFVVRGLGESNFVAPNTSETNRRKNRRVEIHFTVG